MFEVEVTGFIQVLAKCSISVGVGFIAGESFDIIYNFYLDLTDRVDKLEGKND